MPNKFSQVEKIPKYKELTFTNVVSSLFLWEQTFMEGKYIQPKRVFGKLSNSLTFCITFDDLLFVDISSFAVASGVTEIEN